MIAEVERRPDPVAIDLGLFLLTLGEETVDTLNAAIGNFIAYPGQSAKGHNVTIAVGEASSGLTVHCNSLPDAAAQKRLWTHCEVRKYSQKANSWFGVAIQPYNGSIRFCCKVEDPWQPDDAMERIVSKWGEPRPVQEVMTELKAKKKVGRNKPCPCGSGRKYKKCCLK